MGQKEIILNITANDSFQIYPPLNETHALPLSARIQRRSSIHLERLEAKMQKARTAIRGASYSNQSYDPDYVPTGPMYWNANSFHRCVALPFRLDNIDSFGRLDNLHWFGNKTESPNLKVL